MQHSMLPVWAPEPCRFGFLGREDKPPSPSGETDAAPHAAGLRPGTVYVWVPG